MTPNEFWSRRSYKFDCALFRDFVTAQGCVAAYYGFAHECLGEIDPHHAERKKSQGGSDVYVISVCRFHHNEAEKGTTKFLIRIGCNDQSELHQRYIEGFLIFIGACKGEIILPEAKRKPKKSSRRPVSENKKAYVKQPWQE